MFWELGKERRLQGNQGREALRHTLCPRLVQQSNGFIMCFHKGNQSYIREKKKSRHTWSGQNNRACQQLQARSLKNRQDPKTFSLMQEPDAFRRCLENSINP